MPLRSVVFCLAVMAAIPLQRTAAPDLVITDRMHHVRSGEAREWAEFPEQAEARDLTLTFAASANESERTLRLRHRDLKNSWQVLLNGQELARLPIDEADIITYWAVPPGRLIDGMNELRVHSTGKVSDDVMIGEIRLIDRPRAEVLSEATLEVSVREDPGGEPGPVRLTIADEHGTLVQGGNDSGPDEAARPGVIYSRTGSATLRLPSGRYVIHAGRGLRYSVARAEVDLPRDAHVTRRLTIRREVDTTGWAAMDTHVHTGTFARHGDATIEERMLTIGGEGIELPVSAEHNMFVDFAGRAREAGVGERFTPVLGSEVTTPSLGHFNVFPVPPGASPIDQRAGSWQRLGESIAAAAKDPVIVLNHGLDVHGGFRPLDPARHINVAGEDLQGWQLPANAMEVMNSGAVMTDPLALPRAWMGMLNRGLRLTPIGGSDSHDVKRYIVGQARTYVQCDDSRPGQIDVAAAVESVRRGRVLVSYGLLAEAEVDGKGPGNVVPLRGDLAVRVRVKGPGWSRAERVTLYMNGEPAREARVGNAARSGVKFEETWRFPRPLHDVYVVAVATGPGITEAYWPTAKPYQPTAIQFTPYVLGVSGAVFVDADGSGTFESAFEYARREVSSDNRRPLVDRLARYDRAVATQAASLLRSQIPSGFEALVQSMSAESPPHVRDGLLAYLEGLKASKQSEAAER